MNATQTTTEIQTPTLSVAYFEGYRRSEQRASLFDGAATIEAVVHSFSEAVAARRVAKEAAKAYVAGWRTAEILTTCAK